MCRSHLLFLWCKHFRHGQFPATNKMSPGPKLGRGVCPQLPQVKAVASTQSCSGLGNSGGHRTQTRPRFQICCLIAQVSDSWILFRPLKNRKMSVFLTGSGRREKTQGGVSSGVNDVVFITNSSERCMDVTAGSTDFHRFHHANVGAVFPILQNEIGVLKR